MAQPKIYRMYVDDSGEKEYGQNTSRYFVYAGVVVAAADEPRLNAEISTLKRDCFRTADVELKSNWIRRKEKREEHYLKPYGVTEARFDQFVADIRAWMSEMDATFVAVAIDKPQMQARYTGPWYASATAYQFMLQRYEKHLLRLQGLSLKNEVEGQVTMDNMTGSSPKQNQWRELLRGQHRRLIKDGCNITGMRFTHLAPELRFADSDRFHLLQVADLLAYNVFRHYRDHGDVWDAPPIEQELPMYPPLKPLLKRFMRGPNNVLEGWGLVKWPSQRPGRVVLTAEDLV